MFTLILALVLWQKPLLIVQQPEHKTLCVGFTAATYRGLKSFCSWWVS